MHPRLRALAPCVATLALCTSLMPLSGCTREGCLDGSEGCVVPSPCEQLRPPSCLETELSLRVIQPGDVLPRGLEAQAAVGDILLQNSRTAVVIEAIDNVNFIGSSGGFLLDIGTITDGVYDDNDSLNQIVNATSLIPAAGVRYTKMQVIEENDRVAVQVKGTLLGDDGHRVATRYELRRCEPGVRVRTEFVNGGADDEVWGALDGIWHGGRQGWPFTPSLGAGFDYPEFGLSTAADAIRSVPFTATAMMSEPAAAYASVACSVDHIEGLDAEAVSIGGSPIRIVPPGDYLVYERIHLVGNGRGVQPASDLAFDVRRRLFGEPMVTVSGRIVVDGSTDPLRTDRALVTLSEGSTTDPKALRRPWTFVVPDADGRFSARVPAGIDLVAEVQSFGEDVLERGAVLGDVDLDLGTLAISAAGELTLSVTLDGVASDTMVFLYPTDEETLRATQRSYIGVATDDCAPLLGYPYGASPACNRALVNGTVVLDVPPGEYDVIASAGPFASLAREHISVAPGTMHTVQLAIARIPVQPPGTLSADFHVHGAASYDTSFPNEDRVRSFLASGLDVLAATEHDAIYDYGETFEQLGITDEIRLMVGLETTGFVLWDFNPSVTFPQVVGHWNFWPVLYKPERPRGGAPSDEYAEPGTIFMRVKQADLPDWGVIQLNHPIAKVFFGRDFGWMSALLLDFNEPLPSFDDGTAAALFHHRPAGSDFRNSDFHTTEVMNGSENNRFFQYRKVWHYLLNQGVLRAGTANSDSHTLTDNLVGTPRTLVWTNTTKQEFDPVQFNAAVRAGRMIGTTGPVIDARLVTPGGNTLRPSLASWTASDDSTLRIAVTGAPWVHVDEVRIIVNGELAQTITLGVENATDPFGTAPHTHFEGSVRIGDILPGDGRDSWISVEAGHALRKHGDLDCDGIPDTTDNNGDEVVDWRDVDRDGNGHVTAHDLDIDGDGEPDVAPTACEGGSGPLESAERPAFDDDANFPFWMVTGGSYPLAFTNPFILDRNGDGFVGPGL